MSESIHTVSDIPPLIATSVVRGSEQGQSHGGVFIVDPATQSVSQIVDWNTADIDWSGVDAGPDERVVTFGDSGWELFRPMCPEQTPFDLTYLTHDLLSERTGLGLRFHSSTHLTIDFEIDPFTQSRSLIGPNYDFGIGATTLALRFSF